jgi:N12 class adenine-specific DNA methylase
LVIVFRYIIIVKYQYSTGVNVDMMNSYDTVAKKRKRSESGGEEGDNTDEKKISNNCYQGFSWQKESASSLGDLKLDTVQATIPPEEFFERYISPRKPCIIVGCKNNFEVTLEDLVRIAGDEVSIVP